MDITFCVIITVVALILLLAMWVCASNGVQKWGPDLTSELPPHLLKEVLMHADCQKKGVRDDNVTLPSAPSDFATAPLLTNAQPMARTRRPAPPPPPPPTCKKPTMTNITPVRVLPRQFIQTHKLKPTVYSFTRETTA